jgi:hypothetical protein
LLRQEKSGNPDYRSFQVRIKNGRSYFPTLKSD